ncbi:MAG: hypothetical protein U0T83_04675 [Bacteriovoracaceae bacterium]
MNLIKFIPLFLILQTLVFAKESADGTVNNLLLIQKKIIRLQEQLKEKELNPIVNSGEIVELKDALKKTEYNFYGSASQIPIFDIVKEVENKKTDVIAELQDLVTPAIMGLKRISQRPRKIEKLKSQIEGFNEKIELANVGLDNIQKLRALPNPVIQTTLLTYLTKTEDEILKFKEDLELSKNSSERILNQEMAGDKSVVDAITVMTKKFLTDKGVHLLSSFLGFILTLVFMGLLQKRIYNLEVVKKNIEWIKRPLNALYSIVASLLAISVGIAILYLFNDWVLVTFIVILLMVMLWSFKQVVPSFIGEIKLILNLSTVKENERILWNNLPWLVQSLGLHCVLKNPNLEGGEIKVAAKNLIHLTTRKTIASESWFPTQKGDWIFYNNQLCTTVLQTPELVILENSAGSRTIINTAEFFNAKITNLSNGFQVAAVFGLDYAIQANATTSTLEAIKFRVLKIYQQDQFIKKIIVEFHSSGESSLNYYVAIQYSGEKANEYSKLERELQKNLLEIATELKINIPFPNITVNMNNLRT